MLILEVLPWHWFPNVPNLPRALLHQEDDGRRSRLPMLKDFMGNAGTDIIGAGLKKKDNGVDDRSLIAVNAAVRNHPIEQIGQTLRGHMTDMKKVV